MRMKMAVAGAKPTNRPVVHRVKPTHEWSEFPNVAFEGDRPELPLSRTSLKDGEPVEYPLEKRTRQWWEAVSKMPHCVAWQDSDWVFAIETAMVHALAVHGSVSAMAELRMREKILGTTLDARRDLRIRYVDVETGPVLASVPKLDDRRGRLAND